MPKDHLKRVSAPISWEIPRKTSKFVVRPHGYLYTGMPIALILSEILKLTETRKEGKLIMHDGKVTVDGEKITDERRPVILMSVIKIADVGAFRMLISETGKLVLRKEDAKHESVKPCKVISKNSLKGNKTQIGLHDGRTILTEKKDIKPGDSMIFKTPEFKQSEHIKLEKGAKVFLTGGSNVGKTGIVESIHGSVFIKIGDDVIETKKENLFVVGDSIKTA